MARAKNKRTQGPADANGSPKTAKTASQPSTGTAEKRQQRTSPRRAPKDAAATEGEAPATPKTAAEGNPIDAAAGGSPTLPSTSITEGATTLASADTLAKGIDNAARSNNSTSSQDDDIAPDDSYVDECQKALFKKVQSDMKTTRFQPGLVWNTDEGRVSRDWARQVEDKYTRETTLTMHPSMMMFVCPFFPDPKTGAITACIPDVNHNTETPWIVMDIMNNAIGNPLKLVGLKHKGSIGTDTKWVAMYSPVVSCSPLSMCVFFSCINKKKNNPVFTSDHPRQR